jgi:hypothetical protein
MIGTVGWRAFTARVIRAVGSITQRRNSASGNTPAQLSNSWIASAPASSCPSR